MKIKSGPLSLKRRARLAYLREEIFSERQDIGIHGPHDEWVTDCTVELGQFGYAALPTLIEALSHWSTGVRIYACRILGGMGAAAHSAIPALMNFDYSNIWVREREITAEAVAKCLKKIRSAKVSVDQPQIPGQ